MNMTAELEIGAENGVAWKGFRPAGGNKAGLLSNETRALAARYLCGEIGRSMVELPLDVFGEFHEMESDWHLVGPIKNNGTTPDELPNGELLLDKATRLEDIKRASHLFPSPVHSEHGKIDFQKTFSSAAIHSAAYCFTEIDMPAAGMMTMAASCDWYYSVFVNGELIASHNGLVYNFIELPLKAGKNLIGFRVTGGSCGWSIFLAQEACPACGKSKYAFRRVESKLGQYAESVRAIALNAPLRILPGERLVGAATFKEATRHVIPILGCSSISHTTIDFEKAISGQERSGASQRHAILS